MNTASTDAGRAVSWPSPVGSEYKYRTDPSADANRCFTSGSVTRASFASRSRSAAGRFVICATLNFLSERYSQRISERNTEYLVSSLPYFVPHYFALESSYNSLAIPAFQDCLLEARNAAKTRNRAAHHH